MSWLIGALIRWVVHAAVTVAAIRAIAPGNPHNTLGRALLVTFLVAALVGPLTGWLALFIVPLLIAFVIWCAIYFFAYDLGPLQTIGVGILQTLIGWVVGLVLSAVMGGK
jgi:hypothetical protein